MPGPYYPRNDPYSHNNGFGDGPASRPNADPALVSPPDLRYPMQPVNTGMGQHPIPQRMDTVVSSEGKFSVSPASSIHENDDGYGGKKKDDELWFTPSPIRTRTTTQGFGGWFGGLGRSGRGGGPTDTNATQRHDNTRQQREMPPAPQPQPQPQPQSQPQAQALAPSLWRTRPDPDDIPLPAPAHWRGSRELQELNDARARASQAGRAPTTTAYAPVPVLSPVLEPAPAVAPTTAPDEITPALSVPWEVRPEEPRPSGQQNRGQQRPSPGQEVRSDSTGPFMHYEDIGYFGPEIGSEPKDESQVEAAVPRADTFPDIPEGMNRPKARRSWDRQRKRRRKMGLGGGGPGDGRKRRDGGRFGAFWRYCMHWLPEIICGLLSIACLAIIVAVLKTYAGRGLADWPLSISLNTVITFLTAICQVALSVPLTEGLSQLKWNSFARGEKPLADFQTFEDAKRGPLGCAMFLCGRKGRALGMSAATALLTSFLLSPLTQGAITYPTRSFEAGSGTASVARSESYSHPTPYESLDSREKHAIQSGIYHAVDADAPQLQPVCSSGNCEWRNFSSLAVCAAVADVSDRLAVSNQTRPGRVGVSFGGAANNEVVRSARLPNGLFLVGSTTTCNLNVSWPRISGEGGAGNSQESFLPATTSLAFSDQDGRVSSAIANFFLVYTNQTAEVSSDLQGDVFRAAEVLLHFCVNTYRVATSGGISSTEVVHSSTLASPDSSGNTLVNVRDTSSSSSSPLFVLRSASGEGEYSVKRDDVRLLNSYVLSLFSGTYSLKYGEAIGGESATSEALGAAMFQRGLKSEEDVRAAVSNLTANVAASLTNTIRAMSSTTETGTVLATESYVRIKWAWLSFLAIQIVLCIGFLLGIMLQTAVWNVKILKGSSTAALFAISADDKAYLEEREHVTLDSSGGSEHGPEMKRKLRAITCRFMTGEKGWALGLGKREDG